MKPNLSIVAPLITSVLSGMLFCSGVARADDLPRRASIGFGVQPAVADDGIGSAPGATIVQLRPGGPAERAGLKVGDTILKINDAAINGTPDVLSALRTIAGGSSAKVTFIRGGTQQELSVPLDALASETIAGSTVTYSSVSVPDGYRLRTIITMPEASALAADGKVPAFMFIQGIYCASIDRPQMTDAVDTKLIAAMAKAGYATLRVDKPGLGDSQGPPCGEIGFKTELEGYKAALKQLKSLPGVDPNRVYVFGHSMGGVMMPYLVEHTPVRGAIVYGTLCRTWFEYQLENARRQLGLMGASEGDIGEALQAEAKTYAMVLLDKKTMGDVWARYPELKQEDPMVDATHIASRNVSFYQDLQELNLARAWETVTTNVLAIHGEYDWVSSRADHELIASIVNKRTPGFAQAIELPKADHGFTIHASLKASLKAMGQGKWDDSLPTAVQRWIDEVEGRAKPAAPADGKPSADASSAIPEPDAHNAALARTVAAATTKPASFPQSWFGHWRGEASAGDGTRSQTFTTELIIAPTDTPDRFNWTLIYDGAAGRQERAYTLITKDAARGLYQIDENNGILLDARHIDGTQYSHFLVQGNRITTRERLEAAGTPNERIEVEMITTIDDKATSSGGRDDVPEVKSWAAAAIQKATLRRIASANAK